MLACARAKTSRVEPRQAYSSSSLAAWGQAALALANALGNSRQGESIQASLKPSGLGKSSSSQVGPVRAKLRRCCSGLQSSREDQASLATPWPLGFEPGLLQDKPMGYKTSLVFALPARLKTRAKRLQATPRMTEPLGLTSPTLPETAKSDSCGVRTHALSDWRLKPAP